MTAIPQPGSIWRHYKGGLYRVLCTALAHETREEKVVYTSLVYDRSAKSCAQLIRKRGAK